MAIEMSKCRRVLIIFLLTGSFSMVLEFKTNKREQFVVIFTEFAFVFF